MLGRFGFALMAASIPLIIYHWVWASLLLAGFILWISEGAAE